MTRHRSLRCSVLLAAALSCTFALVGCGGDDESADGGDCVVVAPVDGVTKLEVTGKNLAFDVECFEIQPGTVEFTFHNEDEGVSHNFHVSGPGGVNERTDLAAGKTTQTLTVEVTELGRHDFVCDPHATMEGRLMVVDPAAAASTSEA